MNRPPVLMHLRFRNQEHNFGLWLPLFLLLPLALVVLIILSPLILIAVLALWPSGWGRRALLVLKTAFEGFCSMRGLKVDVKGRLQQIYITVV
jgi:hypothetical protein